MKRKPIDINTFAEQVSKRIGPRQEADVSFWKGEELMLGGYKDMEPEKIYAVTVPVFDITDHKQNIIDIYNAKRKHGLEMYLRKYFDKKTLDRLMQLV